MGKQLIILQEEYPLLVFRDVTYFPLTWHLRWMNLWQYHFERNGLTIQAGNHVQQEVVLPDEKKGLNAIEVFDGYYYYVGRSKRRKIFIVPCG